MSPQVYRAIALLLPLVLATSGDLQRLRPDHIPDDVVGRGVGVELQGDHRCLSVIHVEGLVRRTLETMVNFSFHMWFFLLCKCSYGSVP